MYIERTTMLRANIMRVTRKYKAGEGVLSQEKPAALLLMSILGCSYFARNKSDKNAFMPEVHYLSSFSQHHAVDLMISFCSFLGPEAKTESTDSQYRRAGTEKSSHLTLISQAS